MDAGARDLLGRAWSYLGDVRHAPELTAWSETLLPGSLDEPVLVARDAAGLRVLSNVCTHRGAILLEGECRAPTVRCPYHGRRFRPDGTISAAPGFDAIPDEPLPELAHTRVGPMLFGALDPERRLEEMIAPALGRLGFLDLDALVPDPASTRAYEIDAPWSVWCENYLEGLHIPYVHPGLAKTLDLARYRVEVFEECALQIGEAREAEPAFALPDGHPDAARRIGGLYLFVFPFTALNFYPWGLSLNAVQPLGAHRVRVVYRAYEWDAALRERGAGAGLDAVELEDDAIVERAARGMRSRLFRPGRLSEPHEAAVRWFRDRLAREG
jgi:choline monooxygenase